MSIRPDFERLGIFKEMTYHTVGDPYKSPNVLQFNISATKGKQMLSGGNKMLSATAAGYFQDFSRIYEGEAINDLGKIRRKEYLQSKKRYLGKSWVPNSNPKSSSGVGSHFGTFSGLLDHLGPQTRSTAAYKAPGKNIMTNPPKQGTGYGYISVTINPYPPNQSDPYNRVRDIARKENLKQLELLHGRSAFKLNMHPIDYFDPNPFNEIGLKKSRAQSAPTSNKFKGKPFRPSHPCKVDGGMKAGCFDPFPTYSSNPYNNKLKIRPVTVNLSGKTFMPAPKACKPYPIDSIVNKNVRKSVTPSNYKSINYIVYGA